MPTNTPTLEYYNMLPPAPVGGSTTTTGNGGRPYTCAEGALISVPSFDARCLEANGWIKTSSNGAGATSARPANPKKADKFYDTTVGAMVIWTGFIWANEGTGASA